MSLEELLKAPESDSVWKKQRKKLLRLAVGLAVATGFLTAGGFLVYSFTHHKPTAMSIVAGQKDSDSLAELMRLRKQAADMRSDLHPTRRLASNEALAGPVGVRGGMGAGAQIVSYDPGDGFTPLVTAKTELYIPTGAVFQAQLLTPIKTSLSKSFVMAETTNEFRMDMKRRIPKASKLTGTSHFDPILKGVVVEFNTVVFPNGIESSISGLALSNNALPELDGIYFSDRLTTYGTALAFGFLSGFADAARSQEFTLLGSQPTVSTSNQVLTGLSVASFQVADQIMRDIQTSAVEYVVVPAGERVFVVLTRRYDIQQGGTK